MSATLALAVLLAAGPLFEFERTDGTIVAGEVIGLAAGELTLAVDDAERTLPLADLVRLSAVPSQDAVAVGVVDALLLAPPDPPAPADRLLGLLVGGDAYGVEFALPGTAPFAVPYEVLDRLLPRLGRPLDRLAALPGDPLDDRLWLRREGGRLDGITGVVVSVGAGAVVLEGTLGLTEFSRDEVVAAVFAGTAHPGTPRAGAPVEVALAGGSRFGARLLEVRDGALYVRTAFADELRLPFVVVADVLFRRPDVVPLAALAPVEVDERPSIGGPEDLLFPWRRDLSVSGRPLSLGGVERASGIGVHALSRLAFEVPDGARAFAVTVGLCDEVRGLPADASVTFEVLVDGERRAASGVVREGDPPRRLRVERLSGATRLELVVGDAGDLDAGDRAAWADGVFLLGSAREP